MSDVISARVDEALADIRRFAAPLARPAERVALLDAAGRTAAEDVRAGFDFPLFTNSAMDGFAIRTADFSCTGPMPVAVPWKHLITAGHPLKEEPEHGTAVRIMTGAPLPDGFDAVVPIEKTEPKEDTVTFAAGMVMPGTNVRAQGEVFRRGNVMIRRGDRLNASRLGLLASLGYADVLCCPKPSAAVFSSGDELLEPSDGKLPPEGRIYNANGVCVTAIARELGFNASYLGILPDSEEAIEKAIAGALSRFDAVICSGGVGPGDRDYTAAVVNRLGDMRHYHIGMRPGKPFSFGSAQGKLIVGLPGNPAAAATAARVFLPAVLEALLGVAPEKRPALTAIAAKDIKSRAGRRDFVRGTVSSDEQSRLVFTPDWQQSSASLATAAKSNAVLEIPEETERLTAGSAAAVHFD
jgi:molybdopterin molybdotransferase